MSSPLFSPPSSSRPGVMATNGPMVHRFNKLMRYSVGLSGLERRETESTQQNPTQVAGLAEKIHQELTQLPDYYSNADEVSAFQALIEPARRGDLQAIENIHDYVMHMGMLMFGSHRENWLHRGPKEIELPSPLVSYYLAAGSSNSLQLEPDPPGLSMEAYRLAEESALVYLLGPRRTPYRLLLVPSAWGSGKTDHILPHIQNFLIGEGINFISAGTSLIDDEEGRGLGSLSQRLSPSDPKSGPRSRPLPDVILINNAIPPYVSEPRERTRLEKIVRKGLNLPQTRLVLFGGGNHLDTREQLEEMEKSLDRLPEDFPTAVVSVEAKRLNAYQAFQVLTEESTHLSEKDKKLYFEFVTKRLPLFLRVLRSFALSDEMEVRMWGPNGKELCEIEIRTINDALFFFRNKFRSDIKTILQVADVYPLGSGPHDVITPALKRLIDGVDGDAYDFLMEHGKVRE